MASSGGSSEAPGAGTAVSLSCSSKTKLKRTPVTLNIPRKPEVAHFKVLQWNVLADGLAQNGDFCRVPPECLEWEYRKPLLIQEILEANADIICLQELNHFDELREALSGLGYEGAFREKHASPALKYEYPPDGMAVFYRRRRFRVAAGAEGVQGRSFQDDSTGREQSQGFLQILLTDLLVGRELLVVTTHLKAKDGAECEGMRYQQAAQLLRHISETLGRLGERRLQGQQQPGGPQDPGEGSPAPAEGGPADANCNGSSNSSSSNGASLSSSVNGSSSSTCNGAAAAPAGQGQGQGRRAEEAASLGVVGGSGNGNGNGCGGPHGGSAEASKLKGAHNSSGTTISSSGVVVVGGSGGGSSGSNGNGAAASNGGGDRGAAVGTVERARNGAGGDRGPGWSGVPVVVTGDFNTMPGSKTCEAFRRHPLGLLSLWEQRPLDATLSSCSGSDLDLPAVLPFTTAWGTGAPATAATAGGGGGSGMGQLLPQPAPSQPEALPLLPQQREFSTWKFRVKGESKRISDYIWFSGGGPLRPLARWRMLTEEEIGPAALPCSAYASDHVSLCCEFEWDVEADLEWAPPGREPDWG